MNCKNIFAYQLRIQRLRDLFRGPSNHERKLTSSILPVLDTNTFINAAQDKDTDTLQKYLLAGC